MKINLTETFEIDTHDRKKCIPGSSDIEILILQTKPLVEKNDNQQTMKVAHEIKCARSIIERNRENTEDSDECV
jgi:predicted transcriptional regulator